MLEGIGIASLRRWAHTPAYIYARGEFKYPSQRVLDKAIEEAYAAGIFGKKLMGTDFELNCLPGARCWRVHLW